MPVRVVSRIGAVVLLVCACASCGPSAGRASRSGLTHIDGLGSLSFPSSGSAAAQEPFVRGVLLLHSFEFEPAAEAFRDAQAADPGFALAYWGEAMTYNHPLWRQVDVEAARAALARLAPTAAEREAKAPTERERLYLRAVEALYGEGDKTARDAAYLSAMAALQDAFPDDLEARAFHALAILGSRDGARDFATYMRAAATVQPVFDANPDHPGAAHYLIHAFDDPVHAPLGLHAARVYSEIAPEAAHAQHMTSHIFVAMGLWDDVVAANIRARDTQDAQNLERGGRANLCGHYSSWLQYGYLMRGDVAEAEALLDACYGRMADAPNDSERAYFVFMRARQILDTEDWSAASRWPWPGDLETAPAGMRLVYEFTNAFASLRLGDAGPARRLVASRAGGAAGDGSGSDPELEIEELRGLLTLTDGRVDEGIAILSAAADAEDARPFEFGPPAVVKPTHELLGEELLRVGRTDEAGAAFRRAAERTPGRTLVTRHIDR